MVVASALVPDAIAGPFVHDLDREFEVDLSGDEVHYPSEPDPFVGDFEHSEILMRMAFVPQRVLSRASRYLDTAGDLHATCHGVLLSAIAAQSSKQPLVRVLAPPSSILDHVDNCRWQNYADVAPLDGPLATDDDPTTGPTWSECYDLCRQLVGSTQAALLAPHTDAVVTGPHGVFRRWSAEGLAAKTWQTAKQRAHCVR